VTNRAERYRPSEAADLPRECSPALGSRIGISSTGGLCRWDWLDNYPWGEKRWASNSVQLFQFDLKRKDHAYWLQVKHFLTWLAQALPRGNRDWARFAFKALRQFQHEAKRRDWDQVLPAPIVAWASRRLDEEMRGLDCCDNDRVALKGNTSQVRRYRRQKAGGCCGSSDFEAVGPDGKTYLLGFNFGH
jgi:hypothetical protein